MSTRFSVDGFWRSPVDVRIADGGQWRRASTIMVADGSQWRTAWDYDVTGPSAVTQFTATWSNTGSNKCVVSYRTPSDLDLSYVALYVNRDGSQSGPWTLISNFTDPINTVRTVEDATVAMTETTTHAPSGYNTGSPVHYYLAVPYDTLGNQGTSVVVGSTGSGSTVVRGMLSSPYHVQSTLSRTWRTGFAAWPNSSNLLDGTGVYERVIQGFASGGQAYGHYWYDVKRTGVVPTSFQCFLGRTNNGFNTTAPSFYLSQAPSSLVQAGQSPVGYSRSGPTLGAELNNSVFAPFITSAWHTLSTSWWTSLMDGTDFKSLLLYTGETSVVPGYDTSDNFLVFYSRNEIFGGHRGGLLRAYHSG
jgi:hypothetical protein